MVGLSTITKPIHKFKLMNLVLKLTKYLTPNTSPSPIINDDFQLRYFIKYKIHLMEQGSSFAIYRESLVLYLVFQRVIYKVSLKFTDVKQSSFISTFPGQQ